MDTNERKHHLDTPEELLERSHYFMGTEHFVCHDESGEPMTISDAENRLRKALAALKSTLHADVYNELVIAINNYRYVCEEAAHVTGLHSSKGE